MYTQSSPKQGGRARLEHTMCLHILKLICSIFMSFTQKLCIRGQLSKFMLDNLVTFQ